MSNIAGTSGTLARRKVEEHSDHRLRSLPRAARQVRSRRTTPEQDPDGRSRRRAHEHACHHRVGATPLREPARARSVERSDTSTASVAAQRLFSSG
jgi:hypothetical protein